MNEPRYPICPDCQENLTTLDSLHVCPGCGLEFSIEANPTSKAQSASKPAS
jgi:predicted amidophosphoribosyltransferase